MPMSLSAVIRSYIPTLRADAAALYDQVGTLMIAEAQALNVSKILPATAIPSYPRLLQTVIGTAFGDIQYFGYDRIKGIASAFDSAQLAVQAAYTGGSTIPVPPIAAINAATFRQGYIASVGTTKPDKLIYVTSSQTATANNISMAIGTFITQVYF
jgi:hypothetical protein